MLRDDRKQLRRKWMFRGCMAGECLLEVLRPRSSARLPGHLGGAELPAVICDVNYENDVEPDLEKRIQE